MVPIILKSIIIICNINTDWLNVNPKRGTFKKNILYIAEKPLPKALISKIDSNINVKFVFSDFWKTSFKPK